MKSIKQLSLVLVLALTTVLSSCSSDSGSGGGGTAAAGTIKAKAGNVNFTSLTQASYATMNSGMLTIQGSDASGKVIQLIIFGATGAGTYTISEDSTISVVGNYTEVNLGTFDSTTWAAPYENSGAVGTITITEMTDATVKGTFNFTGKNLEGADTKAITNGSFNVNFQGA